MEEPILTPAEQADHARSVVDYPHLDLDDDEYVAIDVERARVGMVFIWLGTLAVSALFMATADIVTKSLNGDQIKLILVATAYLMTILAIAGGLISSLVYRSNYMVVTNHRIFSRLQSAPFAYRQQVIEIGRIEDASYTKAGILQYAFNYGTMRLSTVGEEHTYSLTFVYQPKEQIKSIKKMIHAAKEQELNHKNGNNNHNYNNNHNGSHDF